MIVYTNSSGFILRKSSVSSVNNYKRGTRNNNNDSLKKIGKAIRTLKVSAYRKHSRRGSKVLSQKNIKFLTKLGLKVKKPELK